ncbi:MULTISPECIES: hypothetical protein [Terrabacteria group]|uniref:hypothetical protein n=1 Tax=Bacillati TaxID=1783272 RepID=UPI00193A0F57|nr:MULTISPECIES: hypothetical protein [Terrabacteria group]MBW9213193.1 hypothetical protein [Trueperella sp. zg.1013]QRG86923.1 hypothetical protein JOS54_00990 [Bulleidia sp. zg-1006]
MKTTTFIFKKNIEKNIYDYWKEEIEASFNNKIGKLSNKSTTLKELMFIAKNQKEYETLLYANVQLGYKKELLELLDSWKTTNEEDPEENTDDLALSMKHLKKIGRF